jgi:hypothetical protein
MGGSHRWDIASMVGYFCNNITSLDVETCDIFALN